MARPSHVRDAIAELLAGSDRHDLSADEILAALGERGIPANPSSVFRGLARLEAEGLARRVELGDGRTRYEAAGEHHEHVRCDRCGIVAAVPGCAVEAARPAVERATGFALTGHAVLFRGLCPRCAPEEADA